MVKYQISTGSNVLNANILDMFKLNAQVTSNVRNDEEDESNQGNNVMTFQDIKKVIHTCKPSNSKCITHLQKADCTMSSNMSQYLVKNDYQSINFVSSILLYYCKLYGRQLHHQLLYPQWNEKFQRHHQQVLYDKPNILIYITCSSHKVFSCENCYFESNCNR